MRIRSSRIFCRGRSRNSTLAVNLYTRFAMKYSILRVLFIFGMALFPLGVADSGDKQSKQVRLVKTPDGGIQPQALVDSKETLHLIYFKGDPAAGDLFYVRRVAKEARFSAPIRVNSQAGSAIAVGTIRGGRLALGKITACTSPGTARPKP